MFRFIIVLALCLLATSAPAWIVQGTSGFVPTNAFLVSPTGSDTNPGTFKAPCLTIPAAITAAATSPNKTIYIRAGTYNVPSSGNTCNSNAYGLGLTAGNDGTTLSYWPPDGINKAIIDGGGTTSIGLCIFNGGNSTSVIGLKFQNWHDVGVRVFGGSSVGQGATGVTIRDNVIINTSGTVFGAGVELIGNVVNDQVIYNDIENIAIRGISWIDNGSAGGAGGKGLIIANNFIRNTCTAASDCGQIYLQNINCSAGASTCSTGKMITNNYLTAPAGGYGIYLDDWESGDTVEYNTVWSGSTACFFIHAGANNVFKYNVCDLSGLAGPLTTHAPLQQQSDTTGVPTMTGNVFQNNIVLCASSSTPCGAGYATFAPNPPAAAAVSNNLYFNFTTQIGGVSGVKNTAGPGATADSNPTGASPRMRCYAGYLDQAHTASFGSPVLFQAPDYVWGPQQPGTGNQNIPFSLPQSGTLPSWGGTC